MRTEYQSDWEKLIALKMCIKTLIIYDHMVYTTIYGTALLQTQTHLYAAFGFYKRI